MKSKITLILSIALVFLLSSVAVGESDNPWDDADYVGSDSCKACHQDEYETYYEEATHAKTVQKASEAEPKIPEEIWENQAAEAFQEATEELREDGVSVFTEEIPPYEDVSWTMGGYLSPGEYQIYFVPVETDHGNTYVTLPIRWYGAYTQYSEDKLGEDLDPYAEVGDVGDYRERDWQRCFTCHTGNYEYAEGGEFIDPLPEEQRTDPKTGIVMDDWGWRTPEFEEGVPCESCHGPGGDHVQDAEADSIYGPNEGMEEDELVCARCHVRGASDHDHMEKAWDRGGWWDEGEDGELEPTEPRKLGFPYGYMPGDDSLPDDFSYGDGVWSNWYFTGNYPRGHGQVQEYYQDASFVKDDGEYTEGDEFVLEEFQEAPHAEYADCLDCHSMHDTGASEIKGQGSLVEEGNDVCTQCHTANEYGGMSPVEEMYAGDTGYGVEENQSVHKQAGTDCIDCHMPQTNYPLRSHRFNMIEPEIAWDGPQDAEDSPPITSRGRGRSMADRPGEYMINSCQNAACHTYELTEETDDATQHEPWDGSNPMVLQGIWEDRQEYVQARLDKIETKLDDLNSKADNERYQEAEYNFELVDNDGSLGMHNYQHTIELLDHSEEQLEELRKEAQAGGLASLFRWLRSLFN